MLKIRMLGVAFRDVAFYASIAVFFAFLALVAAISSGSLEADPNYAYLLNGLEILTLKSPGLYVHPGTPAQILIAITIAATWLVVEPFHGFVNVTDAVLKNPSLYLESTSAILMLAIIAAIIFFVRQLQIHSSRFSPALVGAISAFPLTMACWRFRGVGPEPVLLAATFILAGIIVPAGFAEVGRTDTNRLNIYIGILVGFCLAVKAVAAPLLILILFVRSNRVKALAACAIATLLFTLPIASHYREIASWYLGIFTHSGAYGSGAVGAPQVSDLIRNASSLFFATPGTFLCLAIYIVILLAHAGNCVRLPTNLTRLLFFCAVIVAVELFAVLRQPAPRYMITAVPFLCLGNATVCYLLFSFTRFASKINIVLTILIASAAILEGYNSTQQVWKLRQSYDNTITMARLSGCLLVPYYSANLVEFNLVFGNEWSGRKVEDRLQRIYPDLVTFDPNQRAFQRFSGNMPVRDVFRKFQKQKCVYLIGSPMERFDDFDVSKSELLQIDRSKGGIGDAIAVYELRNWGAFQRILK